jgi:hypothetical protein
MIDLVVLLASALISGGVLAFPARRSRWWRLAAVPLCMLTFGLALRFCGRTYPGVFYPDSTFLNNLFNGVRLFTEIGYDLVALLGLADLLFVFLTRFRSSPTPMVAVRALVAVRVAVLALIVLIIGYGFYYATLLQRLPGWTYE